MQSTTLVKSHQCIQLAHLYEHLAMRSINKYLYNKGMYKSLDYAAHGTTFNQGGVILIEVDSYSEEASQHIDTLRTLPITFGESNRNVSLALSQMSAEESNRLHISNHNEVLQELQSLSQTPWHSIEDMTLLDTKSVREDHNPIYLTDQLQSKPQAYRISITLEKDFSNKHRSLMPLFHEIARFSLLTTSDVLAYRYGLYSTNLQGNPHSPSLTSTLLSPRSTKTQLVIDEMTQVTQETIRSILSPQTIARFIKEYVNIDYRYRSHEAPNIERILNETGLLIGQTGWKQSATDININLILNNASVDLKIGHRTATFRLQ